MFAAVKKFFSRFKDYFITLILLVISLSVLSANDSENVKSFRTISFGYFAFLSSIVNYASEIFTNTAALREQRDRNAELMLQVNLLREYGLENINLKKMIEYKDSSRFDLLSAKIISKFVSDFNGVSIINKGLEDSVKPGMPVITDEGLAGIVVDAAENFSAVRTLKNEKFKIAVKDQRSGVSGILVWNGDNLVIKNIPTTFDLQKGDRIITSDFSVISPPSIPVGVVSKRETTAAGALSNVIIQPFVNFRTLNYLFVIKLVPNKQVNNLQLNLFR